MTTANAMPHPERTISRTTPSGCPPRQLEVRWSSLVHPSHDAGSLGGSIEPTRGRGSKAYRIELVLGIQLIADDHVVLEAWLERPGGRRTILSRQPQKK